MPFTHLAHRAIRPISDVAKPDYYRMNPKIPDIANIQGDAVFIFPKRAEEFIFFRIADKVKFKEDLKNFDPTSALDVLRNLKAIEKYKANKSDSTLYTKADTIEQRQIAFSKSGLDELGVRTTSTGDKRFEKTGMRADKDYLGDQSRWDSMFDQLNHLHGVIMLAAHDLDKCTRAKDRTINHFGSSIEIVGIIDGTAREKPLDKHEHFGYLDGVSQPAMREVIDPHPGQIQVDPGVIIMGYPGDPVPNRPNWTKDGTMLVFRKLEQDVIGFERYVAKNGPRWKEFVPKDYTGRDLNKKEAEDLFSARFFGRWKSGAPLPRCPVFDDTKMAGDPKENNNFDYTVPGQTAPSDLHCPFTAHIRKTAPRNLMPYIDKKYLESGSIVRAGIPYGPEVTEEERESYDPSDRYYRSPRGLLFVCYASSLDEGFVRQSVQYGNNDFFPVTSLMPKVHGQDPIIGGPPARDSDQAPREVKVVDGYHAKFHDDTHVNLRLVDADGSKVEVSGLAKVTQSGAQPPPGADNPFWVTSRGGEYFFVPSISTLRAWAIGEVSTE
ncbi:Dyp-type peroxidase family [Ceratobasidium sp. AG-Ba]|nr:Dyp-type peroxidase family [Ceratobasidium sp. AG-Ba]